MKKSAEKLRSRIILGLILLLMALVQIRLFYWQVIKGDTLEIQAKQQSQRIIRDQGLRGEIYTSDNYLLAGNQEYYQLYLDKKQQSLSNEEIADKIVLIIAKGQHYYQRAADDAGRDALKDQLKETLLERLEKENTWILLDKKISQDTKAALETLTISSLQFEAFYDRYYPEASMASHLTGFLGKDENGENLGYFGIEGALNKELEGKTKASILNTDAFGISLAGQKLETQNLNGRNVHLTIRRDLQYLCEQLLEEGIKKYQAQAGEIIIMEPKTGKILSLATWPHYEQAYYFDYQNEDFKNPALTHIYEPGSTFKTITVSAGLDAEVIEPHTRCDKCSGPRKISKYTIKTWNEVYHPNITMTDAIAKSDNIAMIFVAEKLGSDRFVDYLHRFAIGEPIGLDLQGDNYTPFPKKWGPVELATISFGQGISTTSLQLIRAVSAIANQGEMMKVMVVEKVYDPLQGEEIIHQPRVERQVISTQTSQKITAMMVHAAEAGEAQWIASNRYSIAGKTGTSQIAAKGGYDEDKTIASFIGFAPANDPQFIMLVKLIAPESSPWAAETAAPLWYKVANKIFLQLNIPPDK